MKKKARARVATASRCDNKIGRDEPRRWFDRLKKKKKREQNRNQKRGQTKTQLPAVKFCTGPAQVKNKRREQTRSRQRGVDRVSQTIRSKDKYEDRPKEETKSRRSCWAQVFDHIIQGKTTDRR